MSSGSVSIEPRADVERVAIVKHVDLGALAGAVELDGRDLVEVVDERRSDPDLLVELAVDDGRLGRALDANGFLVRVVGRGLRRGAAGDDRERQRRECGR